MSRSDVFLRFMQSLSIRVRSRKIQRFSLNYPQQVVWRKIAAKLDAREKVWLIILKARREGISTLSEALLLTLASTEELYNASVMAHESKATKKIASMADLMIEQSPLKHVVKVSGTQRQIGRSLLDISTAGSPDANRGSDISGLHGSEVAMWPHPEALTATLQCVPPDDSLCILESTAKGKVGNGELFYDEWMRASSNSDENSDFLPIFLSWFDMPDYRMPGYTFDDLSALTFEEQELVRQFSLSAEQLAWRRRWIVTYCQGNLDKFHQEYPSTPDEAFISSGLPFFRSGDLYFLQQYVWEGKQYRIETNGRLIEDELGPVTIYVMPQIGHQYVIGADSSMGIADDERSKSTMQVLDMETLEQVAEYSAASAPHILGKHMVGMGRLYHDALLCPEVQGNAGGGGREVLRYIQDCDYWNLHRWSGSGPDQIQPKSGHLYGWETNSRTRPRMLTRIREVIDEQTAVIHSAALIKQLADFGENDEGRLEAQQGHDDLLFAYGIALVSRSENYYKQVMAPKRHDFNFEAAGMKPLKNFETDDAEHLAEVKRGGRHVLPDADVRTY